MKIMPDEDSRAAIIIGSISLAGLSAFTIYVLVRVVLILIRFWRFLISDTWQAMLTRFALVAGIVLSLYFWLVIYVKKTASERELEYEKSQAAFEREYARQENQRKADLVLAYQAEDEIVKEIYEKIDESYKKAGLLTPAQQKEKEAREEEARKQEVIQELRWAEERGHDVCWQCKTIDPPRCSCGNCISDKGSCTNYGGDCWSCNDDD